MLSNFIGKSLDECLIFIREIKLCLEHQTEQTLKVMKGGIKNEYI